MLSNVEKVLILKSVAMFSHTPDNVLADVADLLEELDVSENETIFEKGDTGDSMYVIFYGKVRVHDGERLLNYLGERDVFGEMALLDPEPRLASVTTVEATRLFRLNQTPFFELMEERPEVATGIIRVLTSRLRDRVRDIGQLNARIKELEGGGKTLELKRMIMESQNFTQAKQYALGRLEKELSPGLYYHGLTHTTDDVIPAVQKFAEGEGVLGEDLDLLLTAAWFHDLGFIEVRTGHEAVGARIASEVLPGFGYSEEQIQTVKGIIMATVIPQSPKNILEEIMADADLDVLGRDDIMYRNNSLRRELTYFGQEFTDN